MGTYFTLQKRFLELERSDVVANFNAYPLGSTEHYVMSQIVDISDDILHAKKEGNKTIEIRLTKVYFYYRHKIVTTNNLLKFRKKYTLESKRNNISKKQYHAALRIIRACDSVLSIKEEMLYNFESNARIILCDSIRRYKHDYPRR